MSTTQERLAYQELGSYRALFLDYLSRYERLAPFFPANPLVSRSWKEAAENVSRKPRDGALLAAALRRQNRDMEGDGETLAAVEALSKGALAVVTGQQVGILGGPLYTLYKALTAVELARRATRELGQPVVALFWMDTDDHDFEEVRRIQLLDSAHGVRRLQYQVERGPAERPMAAVVLEPSIDVLLRVLDEVLPQAEFKADVLRSLRECYRPGVGLPEAFGRFLLKMTRGLGLAIVNPSAPELKAIAAPLFAREAKEHSPSTRPVEEATRRLLTLGYHAQATTDPDGLNLFYASPGRFRIESTDGAYRLADGGRLLSPDELTRLIEAEPAQFSPNVLLRPLYQDTILPTLAYVAGPNELAYFAQLGGVYRAFDVPMPLIFPRASFTIVEPPHARFMKRYGVKLSDFKADDESALNRILKQHTPPEMENDFERARTCLEEITHALSRDLGSVDPTLVPAVRTTHGKVKHLVEELEEKALRALKRKDETLRRQFLAARSALFPEFELQERELSPVQFLAKYGWGFVDIVRQSIDLDSRGHGLIYL